MAIITNKRSVIILYTESLDVYSHRVRIVLAEKGVVYESINIDERGKRDELLALNPYGTIPTLVDRDLVLYEPNIIIEYLDERFPHPPLMPVYPVSRAKARLVIHRFDQEWKNLVNKLNHRTGSKLNELRVAAKELGGQIAQLAPILYTSTYFMGEEFTLVDCCLAPILWRLASWRVGLPPNIMKMLHKYMERVFQRNTFQASLTEKEEELQKLSTIEAAN